MTNEVQGLTLAVRAMYETLAISVPTLVDSALARMTAARADERLARWSRRLLDQAGVTLTVSGAEHVVPGRPYVVMSNHQSHYDVPVLFQSFPATLRMVAKTELYRVPVFGRALTISGFIEIDRSNRERAIASLNVAKGRLAEGVSVWIAPEGTRSRTGELLAFKKGGFVLAQDTGLAIVPVGIVGSRDILPAEGRVVHRGARVHVSIKPPMASRGDRDTLMADVRAAIARGMADAAAHRLRDTPHLGETAR